MRISDWSSDVCSSDLRLEQVLFRHRPVGIAADRPRAYLRPGRRSHPDLVDYGPPVPLVRYLATRRQYRYDDRDLPNGFPDPEHAEPRRSEGVVAGTGVYSSVVYGGRLLIQKKT